MSPTCGRWKSNRWQRETMVSGILCGSVVASTKTTLSGRLLERLEQGVEGLAREHVDLVHDVHLEAAVDRREGDLVAQVAHVVDAAVGGGVHLDDVQRRAVGDGDAVAADAARRGGGAVPGAVGADAVERLGEDARGARLPGAARPGEDVGVGDLVGLDRVAQGARDVVLSDELGEGLGAVLSVQRTLHGMASVPREPVRPRRRSR